MTNRRPLLKQVKIFGRSGTTSSVYFKPFMVTATYQPPPTIATVTGGNMKSIMMEWIRVHGLTLEHGYTTNVSFIVCYWMVKDQLHRRCYPEQKLKLWKSLGALIP